MTQFKHVLVDAKQGLVIEAATSPFPPEREGLRLKLPISVKPTSVYWHKGEWIALPTTRPSRNHKFNPDLGAWCDSRSSSEVELLQKRAFDDRVNLERIRRTELGTDIVVPGVSKPVAIQGRPKDWRALSDLCLDAQLRVSSENTDKIRFRDRNNKDHMLSPRQVIELWRLSKAWESELKQASWLIKDRKVETTNIEDNSLWPLGPSEH